MSLTYSDLFMNLQSLPERREQGWVRSEFEMTDRDGRDSEGASKIVEVGLVVLLDDSTA